MRSMLPRIRAPCPPGRLTPSLPALRGRALLAAILALTPPATAIAGPSFIRGDSNADGVIQISDATSTLAFLFVAGAPLLPCRDAADFNDDGGLDIADAIGTLGYLFVLGSPPPAPFPGCGTDPSADALDCAGPVPGCATGPGPGPLFAGRSYLVPGGAAGLLGADLDGDGTLDLSCLGAGSGSVSTVFGLGDGGFSAATLYTAGWLPVDFVLAELDGLPGLDLAVQHIFGSTGLGFLSGSVDGSFGPMGIIATWSLSFGAIASGDVNSDGAADLVGRDIYVASGAGGFLTVPMTWPSGQMRDIELVDVDADGDLDILAVVENPGSQTVSLYLGDGSGIFGGVPISYPTGQVPHDLEVADVDGDGLLDIVTANFWGGDLSVLRGDPAALFLPPISFPVSAGMVSEVELVDVDGDLVLDALVPTADGLVILAGDPFQIFAPPQRTGAGGGDVVVSDLDGDGELDYALAAGSRVDVHLGRPGGSILAPPNTTIPASLCLASGDLGGDGIIDAVSGGASGITIAEGTGSGTFTGAYTLSSTGTVNGVALGHLDSDGALDIVAATSDDTLQVLRSTPSGVFGPVQGYATGDLPRAVGLADLDGDGDLDAIVANQFSNTAGVHLGNGAGSFAPSSSFIAGTAPWDVEIADLDEDGVLDIATANQGSSSIGVLLGAGGGTFDAAVQVALPHSPIRLRIGDIDGDGHLDLAAVSAVASRLMFRLGTGTGTFGPAVAIPTVTLPVSLFLADVDADGDLDALVAGQTERVLGVHFGGSGGFGPPEPYGFEANPSAISVVDLDGDGDLDVLGGGGNALEPILNRSIGP